MTEFLAILTQPFVALLVSLAIIALSLGVYGVLSSKKLENYSRFLTYCRQAELQPVLFIVAGVVGLIATSVIVGSFDVDDSENPTTIYQVGYGIYAYLTAFIGLFFYLNKASFLEKRDIKGLHKQKTKRLQELLTNHLREMDTVFAFQGKTQMKVQQILSQLKNLNIEVQQEKKIRKNKENIYRSLDRLERLERERSQIIGQMEQLQKQISNMYDVLYGLEAIALEQHTESVKKQLHVAKEKIKNDPFEAHVYLERIKRQSTTL